MASKQSPELFEQYPKGTVAPRDESILFATAHGGVERIVLRLLFLLTRRSLLLQVIAKLKSAGRHDGLFKSLWSKSWVQQRRHDFSELCIIGRPKCSFR